MSNSIKILGIQYDFVGNIPDVQHTKGILTSMVTDIDDLIARRIIRRYAHPAPGYYVKRRCQKSELKDTSITPIKEKKKVTKPEKNERDPRTGRYVKKKPDQKESVKNRFDVIEV